MKHYVVLTLCFVISILSFFHLGKQAGARELEEQLFQSDMIKKHLMAELDVCNSNWKTTCGLSTVVYQDHLMYKVSK